MRTIVPALSRAHIEMRIGTQAQAMVYCRKPESKVIGGLDGLYGVPAVQGQRTDLLAIRDEIMEGATQYEIAVDHFPTWVRNYRAFALFAGLHANHLSASTPRPFPVIIILWGVSGTGKSHWAEENFPGALWLSRPQAGSVWFDLMTPRHRVVVIDEYYSWLTVDFLLRLCDHYPLQLPTKGGFIQCPPLTTVVFTSNDDPRTWYHDWENFPQQKIAFWRRIEEGGGYIREKIPIGCVRPPRVASIFLGF